MKRLILFLLPLVASAQTKTLRTNQDQQFLNAYAQRNYVKNSGAENNTLTGVTASGGSLTITTSAPLLEGGRSFAVDASASAQTYTWAAEDFQLGLLGSTCEYRITYSGDASLYKSYATLAGVLVGSQTTLSNTSSNSAVVTGTFPCGSSTTDDPAVVIESTSSSAAAIKVDSVYIGIATSTASTLASGTTTPTAVGVTNIDSVSATSCKYIRNGNIVSGVCVTTVDCATAPLGTEYEIPPPISSNFTSTADVIGGMDSFVSSSAGESGVVTADTTSDRIQVNFGCTVATAQPRYVDFFYEVK